MTDLEKRLGHVFADKNLLKRALTHASANQDQSNERLEFLGDRVLGLVIAEKLHLLFPADAEGALALKYNAMARGEACAQAAEAAGLADHIILARSEAGSGGRHKMAILSGTCEAVIAALYLDGGLDVARAFIDRYWADILSGVDRDMRDAKTRLQEWAQARKKHAVAPIYNEVGRSGPDHAPRFSVQVVIADLDPVTGEGSSKREAEQDAASRMLKNLGIGYMTERCGYVAVIGAPNAGKSTLVNALVGSKVAIVSPKVQTTRMAVRGVALKDETQIVFVDTPGIFKPKRRLDRAMVNAAWAGADDANAILLMVDAPELLANPRGHAANDTASIVDNLKGSNRKAGLVLNKIDGMKRTDILPLIQQFSAHGIFDPIFLVSALKGDGQAEIMNWCVERMPEGPWLYPADQAADIPSRLLASEITREKIYHRLHDELPYASTVETDKWEERKDGSVKIDQTIYVQRDGQKAIALGKGGATIKKIGELARTEMEEIFDRRVHLFLFVKVREDWAEQREHYKEMGLEYPDEK